MIVLSVYNVNIAADYYFSIARASATFDFIDNYIYHARDEGGKEEQAMVVPCSSDCGAISCSKLISSVAWCSSLGFVECYNILEFIYK